VAPAGPAARRIALSLAGLAVSATLLLWALRGVSFADVVRQIQAARPLPLAAAVLIASLTYPIRLVRWRFLLRDDDGGPLPAAPLWHAVAIGFMANNTLPFRAGELVRVFTVTRLAGVRFSAALSSIAVERVFDALAVVTVFSLALLGSDLPPSVTIGGVSVAHAALVAGALGVAALALAILVVALPLAAEAAVRAVLPAGRLTDRLVGVIEGIRQGLTVLRSPARLAGVVFWSLVLWCVNALAFHVAFAAFGIPVGYGGALVMQGVLVLGISVQFTPGFVGQFEAAIVAALALYGISNALASSYAIAFHMTTFVPIILLGAWSLMRTPVALSDLRRSQA
jgi:uncharacterized protein (TIRG00374 family)